MSILAFSDHQKSRVSILLWYLGLFNDHPAPPTAFQLRRVSRGQAQFSTCAWRGTRQSAWSIADLIKQRNLHTKLHNQLAFSLSGHFYVTLRGWVVNMQLVLPELVAATFNLTNGTILRKGENNLRVLPMKKGPPSFFNSSPSSLVLGVIAAQSFSIASSAWGFSTPRVRSQYSMEGGLSRFLGTRGFLSAYVSQSSGFGTGTGAWDGRGSEICTR